MRHGSRRRRGSRWCWWSWPARCWGTPCRMRWTLGRRELLEYGLVELVASIERNLPVGNSVLAEPPRDPVDDLRRDELVRPAVHERHTGRPESSRGPLEREVQVRRKLAAPQCETIDQSVPHCRPPADRGGSLRISQGVQGHLRASEGPEHVRVYGIEVSHVVIDLGEPILARHPARADAPLRGTLAQVEPGQALRRHEVTPPVVEHAQLLQESTCELTISVARKPDLPNPPRTVAQGEVACAASHSDVVLLHLPTPNAECGMRNRHPPFNSAFRIPHSALKSLRWSRPHAARRRIAPSCPAPRAPGRPI